MTMRKISTQDFLKLEFKIKKSNDLRIDCVDNLDPFFSASLTLVTDCDVELKFTNVLLCFDSYDSTNNAFLRKVTNEINYDYEMNSFYLAVHYSESDINYSELDITLKGCLLIEEQSGSSKLNKGGYMSVAGSNEIFLTVLAQVLKKTPWKFGIGTVYKIYQDPSGQGILVGNKRMVDILKMEQVNNSCQDEMEEEFEEYAYQCG